MYTDPRYPQVKMESGAQVSHGCNLAEGIKIGSQVKLESDVVIGANVRLKGEVHLGHKVIIRQDCTLVGPLQIDEGTIFAPHVQVGPSLGARTHIRTAVRVGVNTVIMGGVTIGSNSFIRSNSKIIGDVPDHSLVGGDPAYLEDYVCPSCASRLSVVRSSPNHLVVYLKCRQQCGSPEIRVTSARFLPLIGHVLLPGQTPGKAVNLSGHNYAWVDVYEMMDRR